MPRPTPLSPLAALAALALAACVTPALSGQIEGGDWHLIGLEGTPAPFRATIAFEGDRVGGQAPCNRWFGTNRAALPEVAIDAIGATKMACPDLAAESAWFETLQAMTRAELDQGHLFLIGAEGRVLEFVRDPAVGEPCLSCTPAP
jgi:heat shock protein HslJ